MDRLQFLAEIKTAAIAGVFSDDRLLEELVLKGGNALDIAYGASTRASVDLDFSMGDEFEAPEALRARIEGGLIKSFREIGYIPFDVTLAEVPPQISDDLKDFWGGYKLEFKIASINDFHSYSSNIDALRRRAIAIGESNSTKFKIDISKHEFRDGKRLMDINGLSIFVYSPEMIVCEKIRAICQQMIAYAPIVKRIARPGSARARDFVDIHVVCSKIGIDFESPEFHRVVRQAFEVKKVPLALIGEISKEREFHRLDFPSVIATVKADVVLKEYDFYFDFVIDKCKLLEPLWKIDSP